MFCLAACCAWLTPGYSLRSFQSDVLRDYPWLYLRDQRPVEDNGQAIELLAVGDVLVGRGVAAQKKPFDYSASWLRAADLTLGNLEGVMVQDTNGVLPFPDPGYAAYRLLAPASAVTFLKLAGFDLLGLANNHAWDGGATGLEQTVSLLKRSGITPIGVVKPGAENQEVVFVTENGVRLAFLAVNAVGMPGDLGDQIIHPALWDEALITNLIQTSRQQADVVIVSVHWGYEYETRVDPGQEAMAARIIRAGADLVLGHHTHVVQATQVFQLASEGDQNRIGFVAYSLGNFLFDQGAVETRQGLALRILVDKAGLRAVQALPVKAGLQPRLETLDEASALLERIRPKPVAWHFTCNKVGCSATELWRGYSPREPSPGIFTSGSIDLTGDGRPETVKLADYRVSIWSGEALTWQSPLDWQVLDAALGDPNDDGRYEVVLVLNKLDAQGIMRSHPFIIGYRSGTYRQVWGGSAVSESILEVELGDVDGDGVEDLIILDELSDRHEQTAGVWKWNGWGFSLAWRSQPGRFEGLVLEKESIEGQPAFSVGVIR